MKIAWRLLTFITLPIWILAAPIANLVTDKRLSYDGFKDFILWGYDI